MINPWAPLGRPPLDTFSPAQVIRSADVMPAGIWEIEGGVRFTPAGTFEPAGGIRTGLLPGLQLDLALPSAGGDPARKLFTARYAPIPALWSLDLAAEVPLGGSTPAFEGGTTLEIGLPWGFTPRVSPRVTYLAAPGGAAWLPRVATGLESRFLRVLALGLDYDHGFQGPSTLNFGLRARLFGNLGAAFFVWAPTWALSDPAQVRVGALAAMRF